MTFYLKKITFSLKCYYTLLSYRLDNMPILSMECQHTEPIKPNEFIEPQRPVEPVEHAEPCGPQYGKKVIGKTEPISPGEIYKGSTDIINRRAQFRNRLPIKHKHFQSATLPGIPFYTSKERLDNLKKDTDKISNSNDRKLLVTSTVNSFIGNKGTDDMGGIGV